MLPAGTVQEVCFIYQVAQVTIFYRRT